MIFFGKMVLEQSEQDVDNVDVTRLDLRLICVMVTLANVPVDQE